MYKKILVLVLVLPLSACTAFGFLFDRLPWLTAWHMDDLFDLRDEQRIQVKASAKAMQQWMKDEGFPLLISDLETTQSLWENGQLEQAATHLEQSIRQRLDAFFTVLSPHLVSFLLTLDASQAEHYRAYNDSKVEEWFEHAESNKAKQEHRLEKLEDWFGSLNDEQEPLVAQHILLLNDEYTVRVQNNQHWKERMLSAALQGDKQALSEWTQNFSLWWTDDYRQLREQNRAQWHALLKQLLPSLSTRQREHAAERVSDWADNLRSVL